jgi:amino acid transporter
LSNETHTPNPNPQLRSNSLGLSELVFQAVTHIAPASNVIFAFPIIALKAGPVMPISLLLATIVCLFIGNTVSQFSSYMPSSGGYYSFATHGLGSHPGFMATWSYLIYEIPGNAGLTGFLGYFVSDMLHTEFKINIPWWLISLATIALVWTLTYRGIQLSARVTAILGLIEILIILAMSITFLIHPGKGSSYTAPLNPYNAPNHFGGVLAGMVFSILALSGFEAPAPMAQEAKRPASFVAKAITLSLFAIGGFYIFTSYAAAIGWGTGDMAAFASNANPYYVLGHAFWGVGWWAVVLALVNSAVGVGLAATNATSRVMYTMGRAGTLPAKFARIHPVHQTPTYAIGFFLVACAISIFLVGFLLTPDTIFNFLETVATLAVIVLYIMSNLALTRYMRRQQPTHFSILQHGIVPWIATLCLLPVLFITVYPRPVWPYNITPYIFVVAMFFGFVYMKWRESANPGSLDRAAAMLTTAAPASETVSD